MGVKKYTQEVIKEAKRVRWAKKEDFISSLVTTIIVCALCAGILVLWDLVGNGLIEALRDLF